MNLQNTQSNYWKIPEWKIQFFENIEKMKENTLNKAEQILTSKEKLQNLLKLFNETFSIREMAKILQMDRNTVSVYLKGLKISEEKCLVFLNEKEEAILDSIYNKINEQEKYDNLYSLMQVKLFFFNSKIIEKDLCVLLDIKLSTLMSYKTWNIKNIWFEKLNELLKKIDKITEKYLNDLKDLKETFEFLNNFLSIKEICINFKIPTSSYYWFLEWWNLKYNYLIYFLKNKNNFLLDYPKNIEEYTNELKKVQLFFLSKKKIILNYKDICKKYKISEKAYRKLMNWEFINYKYVKNILLFIEEKYENKNSIKLNSLNRIKENDEYLKDFIDSKENFEIIFIKNFWYFIKIFGLFNSKNRIKLASKWLSSKNMLNDYFEKIDYNNIEKIEKLLI